MRFGRSLLPSIPKNHASLPSAEIPTRIHPSVASGKPHAPDWINCPIGHERTSPSRMISSLPAVAVTNVFRDGSASIALTCPVTLGIETRRAAETGGPGDGPGGGAKSFAAGLAHAHDRSDARANPRRGPMAAIVGGSSGVAKRVSDRNGALCPQVCRCPSSCTTSRPHCRACGASTRRTDDIDGGCGTIAPYANG